MWWKIFFWIMLLLTLLALIGSVTDHTSFMDVLEVVNGVIGMIGLYAFVYNKKYFSRSFWYWFFWINLIWDLAITIYILAPTDPIIRNLEFLSTIHPKSVGERIFILLFSLIDIPYLYALYCLSKHDKKKKKK